MRTRHFSILAALLTVGCAHGQKSETQTARAETEPNEPNEVARAESHDATDVNDRDRDETSERVEVPDRGTRPNRMASTGRELPGGREEGKEAQQEDSEKYGAPADNTRINERDRSESKLTPMDQGESESDRELTARIRKSVVSDDQLSFRAKNVKIITRDGRVTLRGPVKSEQERASIERIAREIAGSTRVTNELEIAK